MYVVQYWDVDTRKESFKSLKHTLDPSPAWINSNADWESIKTDTGITVTHTMNTGDIHPLFPDYEVDIYSISNSFNWFTGKGQISGDIWLNKKDGTKNRNPKIEIMAAGKCQPQKKKFQKVQTIAAIKNAKITIPIGTYLSKLSESVFKIFSIILLVIKSPTVV